MADTRRTLSAIQALLADNTSAAISPQDVRDAIKSASSEYGSMYFSTASTTTISGAGTPTKAAGTTTSQGASSGVTVATTNRMTYTESPTLDAMVSVTVSLTCSLSNQVLGVSIAKNGTQITGALNTTKIGTGTDVIHVAVSTVVELAQNDYVEVFVQNNDSGSGTITVEHGQMTFTSIFV